MAWYKSIGKGMMDFGAWVVLNKEGYNRYKDRVEKRGYRSVFKRVAEPVVDKAVKETGKAAMDMAASVVLNEEQQKRYKDRVAKTGYTATAARGIEAAVDTMNEHREETKVAVGLAAKTLGDMGVDVEGKILSSLSDQTGISSETLKQSVLPLLGENVIDTASNYGVDYGLDYVNKGEKAANNGAAKKFLSGLASAFEKNPQKTIDGLRDALLVDGQIPKSVQDSKILGPLVDGIRSNIPAEVRDTISEKDLFELTNASLSRMASTEEGKALIANTLRGIDPSADPNSIGALLTKENENGNSFASYLGRATTHEFLSRPALDKSYHDFQDRIFNKDSVGRLTLKENVSPAIRDMITGVQKQVPPMIAMGMDEGAQMGLAASVFQKILDDPKKREALKPYLLDPKNPENFQAMVQLTKDSLTETLTGSADRALIVDSLKENFRADPAAEKLNHPQEWYEKDAQTIATSLPNILLREDIVKPVMGVVQADQTGNISIDYKEAMKHAKEGILSALEKGETTQDAQNILGVYFRQGNPLNLPDNLNERFAKALSQPKTASLIRQILPDDLSEKGVKDRIQDNLLAVLRTPDGRDQIASILDPELRRGITASVLSSETGLAPQYASSLSQVLSDDDRFKKVLGIIGESEIKDGKLQNAGKLVNEAVPDMLNTDADRRVLAQAITPTVRAPLGIKDNNASIPQDVRETLKLKDDSISPFAVVSAHFMTSKTKDEFMNRPVIGADGKKYNNLADYLDDADTKAEIKKLKGNKDAIDFLSRTSEGEWKDLCQGLFPDDATFKKFKETLVTAPDKAFKTEAEGGPLKEDPQKIVRGAYTNLNQTFSGLAYVFGCGTLSRIEEAAERGEDLVKVDPKALTRKPESLLDRLAEEPKTDTKTEPVQKAEDTKAPTVGDDKPKREGLISALTDMVQTAKAEQTTPTPENTATAEPPAETKTTTVEPKQEEATGMNTRLAREVEKQTPTPEQTKAKGSVIMTAASDQKGSAQPSENVFAKNAAKNRYSNAA